ncbi:LptF/LptG family permease [Aurantimonas sp. A2-1-M11]|uniref:LptF/LptG family permease n=1 Tax=Aurantimonas sp. A2-1-M11 TaxID=3113712 RepID=UPI002F91F3CB
MTILERYIFRRAFVYAASSLTSLVLIVWIVQALSRIDIVKTSASAAGNIFWIALMLLPDLAAGVMPFALLIGAIQALNSLNSDSERAVISAAGASQKVIARPIIALGLLGGLIMLLIANVVGPASMSAFQNGIRSINADMITLFLKPGRFEQVQQGILISIGDVNGATVKSLVIADTRDPASDLTYFAREAKIIDQDSQSLLLLFDGQLHRRNTADNSVSVIQFQTYAFDLAELRPATDNSWVRASERSTAELISPDPNDGLYQERPYSFTEELTDRMTNWLFAIAFVLWAIVVAGHPSTNRQGTGPAMAIGLCGGLSLKAAGFVVLSQIEQGFVWVLLAYLLPLAAIALNSLLIWRNFDMLGWAPLQQANAFLQEGIAALSGRRRPAEATR